MKCQLWRRLWGAIREEVVVVSPENAVCMCSSVGDVFERLLTPTKTNKAKCATKLTLDIVPKKKRFEHAKKIKFNKIATSTRACAKALRQSRSLRFR
jgi:hypothetical protein